MSVIDIFAFVGGLSAKLYDDIEDNEEFIELRKNIFLTELLKGLHYISFMSVGLTDNLFYLISYLGNLLHSFKNEEAFAKPYENSLIYSFSLGLLLLNYRTIYETIETIQMYEIFGILFFLACMFIEPFFIKSETSLLKLCVRISLTFISVLLYFLCAIPTNKYIFLYSCGYMLSSSIVQYISINKKIKDENDDEIDKIVKSCILWGSNPRVLE